MPGIYLDFIQKRLNSGKTFTLKNYYEAVLLLISEIEKKFTKEELEKDDGFQVAKATLTAMSIPGCQLEAVFNIKAKGAEIKEASKGFLKLNKDKIYKIPDITGPASLALAEGYHEIITYCVPGKLYVASSYHDPKAWETTNTVNRGGLTVALNFGMHNAATEDRSGYDDFKGSAIALKEAIANYTKAHEVKKETRTAAPTSGESRATSTDLPTSASPKTDTESTLQPSSSLEGKTSNNKETAPSIAQPVSQSTLEESTKIIQAEAKKARAHWVKFRDANCRLNVFLEELGCDCASELVQLELRMPDLENGPDDPAFSVMNDIEKIQKDRQIIRAIMDIPFLDITKEIAKSEWFQTIPPEEIFNTLKARSLLSEAIQNRWKERNSRGDVWSRLTSSQKTIDGKDRRFLLDILTKEMSSLAQAAHRDARLFLATRFDENAKKTLLVRQNHKQKYQPVMDEITDFHTQDLHKKLKGFHSSDNPEIIKLREGELKKSVTNYIKKHEEDRRVVSNVIHILRALDEIKPAQEIALPQNLAKLKLLGNITQKNHSIIKNIAYQAICDEAVKVLSDPKSSSARLGELGKNISLVQLAMQKTHTPEQLAELKIELGHCHENPKLNNRFRGFCMLFRGLISGKNALFLQGLASLKSGYSVSQNNIGSALSWLNPLGEAAAIEMKNPGKEKPALSKERSKLPR